MLRTTLFTLLLVAPSLAADPVRVLSAGPDGLVLELRLSPARLVQTRVEGRVFDDLAAPGYPRLDQPGRPNLPFVARVLAAPPGARVDLDVRVLHHTDLEEVSFVPAAPTDGPSFESPPASTGDFFPGARAAVEPLGRLRGVPAHSLRFYPFRYSPARRVLRVYDHLQIRVRFIGGRRPQRAAPSGPDELYRVFLNFDQAAAWSTPARAAKSAADDWYDPALPWVKIFVETDGLFRIDPAWLRERQVDVEGLDPRTLRLFLLGQEQAVHVRGEADGRFDEDDCLIFPGRFRRDDRDFGSLYGPRNTYWLTWGGETGKRFATRSGAPVRDYPESPSFWTTAHFEVDLKYDPLPDAPDDRRDHWFWEEPVKATKPDVPASRTFTGDLKSPDLEPDYAARLRVSLHGASDLGHHTVVKLNNRRVDDRIWGGRREGQVELPIDAEIPSSYLREGRNRLLLQVFADQEKFDLVYLNWFAIDYRRRYRTWFGYLEFAQPSSDGHRITVSGFRDTRIELFDVANSVRFTDLRIDSLEAQILVTFEARSPEPASYVIADSLALRVPGGALDTPSSWRRSDHRADYLIIAHPELLAAARTLADHRRTSGLEAAVVSADDIYDEFSYGLVQRQAIADFIRHAYRRWERRPAHVLLFGDDTYDYRNIYGGGALFAVPTLYYQSRGRGRAPSDFLYALVDGDDLLPDLTVGRLAVSTPEEAFPAVDKIVRYDRDPEPGDWRSRVIYLANYHPKHLFTAPSDSLAARFTAPLGLVSVKVYNPDESPIPNATGRKFVDALNHGSLLLNFSGHGSPGTMQFVFSLHLPDWDYLSQVRNGGRLPLVLALSCLNGMFANPILAGLAEVFTTRTEGGAIAYISASAQSFPSQNNLLSEFIYAQLFQQGHLGFGSTLNAAKIQVLAAHPGWDDVALTMQLLGDPAQELALPGRADYAPLSLQVSADQVFGHSTLQVESTLRNNTRLTADSLVAIGLGWPAGGALPETLFVTTLAPFAGTRTLSFPWPVGGRRGSYRLELRLDPEDRVPEEDEGNNDLDLDLDILEPLLPALVFPPASAVVAPQDLSLEALAPPGDGPFSCAFSLSTDPGFTPENTWTSPPVPAESGLAAFRPAVLAEDRPYFWRVRVHTPRAAGSWSESRSFQVSASPAPGTWHQRGAQLLAGAPGELALSADGQLTLSAAPLPFRPSSATREDGFTVRGLDGAGVLCTDGTYVYVKRWYNDDSTIYPGIDHFTRVGTGFNDIHRTGNFGLLADSTTAGISATYHSDGFIYSESGRAFELERISAATGRLDTVAVPDGLLEWRTGRVEDGHSLITSDGRFIYNVSMSSEKGVRAEWSVRVFDPADGWSRIRQFTSPPTETGFTFEWTDGILADGRRLYFIEYGDQRRIRMVDAVDGRFLDEWTSDQDTTRIISGQYDWINNKVWLGDLMGSAVFRYAGLGQADAGTLTSEPVGPASQWRRLRLAGKTSSQARLAAEVLVQDGETWAPHPDFADLPVGQEVDLSHLDASAHPRIRLRARLEGSPQTVALDSWTVDFAPRSSLQLTRARGEMGAAGLQVILHLRNLSAGAVDGARLRLERSDRFTPVLEHPLNPLRRGETRRVVLDSLELPPSGVRLFAQVLTSDPDADPADNRLGVPLLFAGRAPLVFQAWPGERPFLSGDPLLPGQGLLISAPDLPDARVELTVDGAPAEPDSLLDAFPSGERQILYRPRLAPGTHRLQARLFRDGEEIGFRQIRFRLTDVLTIANPLIYPHPVRERAAFTYVLSRDAEVEVEIYSLGGRLVRRLGPEAQAAGFQQVAWDGRGADGHLLANGTYLFRIRARSGDEKTRVRGPLVVVR